LANGFDGFISKPIDSRELDATLGRLIRDKQPREVIEATRREQRKREAEKPDGPDDSDNGLPDLSELKKYFVMDAEKKLKVIEKVYADLPTADAKTVRSYITAVHGMKSALADIGEAELSAVALKLEKAGDQGNFAVTTEETPAFMDALRFLIDEYSSANIPATTDEITEISESDAVYLRDKLIALKTACQAFDITAAKDALGDLHHKTWPRYVNAILDEISMHLLHSAFSKAAALAETTAKM